MSEHQLKSKDDSTPWKGTCSKRCYFAKRKKCRCKCHGQHHQRGLAKEPGSEDEFKRLVDVVPLNDKINEMVLQTVEKALKKHPEWAKHVKEEKA
ncbi:hypothetical protein MUP77_22850 [Candidatus Bathyarchaeota archaeon]|nr:hypothetical protein [Candidatus Bathyarchaeota archaeon]